MPKTPKRSYGYVRVFTDEQVEDGISLRAQRARIKAYAESQGMKLVRTYADEGLTGRTMDRPKLNELIDTVKGKQGETIIVYRLSRLTRRTRDLLFLVEDVFINGNTRLISITGRRLRFAERSTARHAPCNTPAVTVASDMRSGIRIKFNDIN